MPRCGLLVESIYLSGKPIHLGTAAPDAWPALLQRFEAEGIDFLAVELRPVDSPFTAFAVFASAPFSCRPAPWLARVYSIRGQSAKQLPAHEGAVLLLAAAHEGKQLAVSDGWSRLIQL
jgi:hypothetical protein